MKIDFHEIIFVYCHENAMKKFILFLLIIHTILFSCKKEGEGLTKLEGKITNFYTAENIDGYRMIVKSSNDDFFTSISYILDTITSNENGEFYYSFQNQRNYFYTLESLNNDYSRIDAQHVIFLDEGENNKFNFGLNHIKL